MDEDLFDECFDDEFETIVMVDDETGEEIQFSIIDFAEKNGCKYLLVVEDSLLDDDEADAVILKEVLDDVDEIVYEIVEDGDEFDDIAIIFQKKGENYDIEVEEQ